MKTEMDEKHNLTYPGKVLKTAIEKHSDLPIILLIDPECVTGEFGWEVCDHLSCETGEYLYCPEDFGAESVFTQRDEFEEALRLKMFDDYIDDDDMESKVQSEIKRYEPFWTKCLIVYVE